MRGNNLVLNWLQSPELCKYYFKASICWEGENTMVTFCSLVFLNVSYYFDYGDDFKGPKSLCAKSTRSNLAHNPIGD